MSEVKQELVDGMRNPVFLGGYIHADYVIWRVRSARWPFSWAPWRTLPGDWNTTHLVLA